ncbi:hypothetical protein MNBD_GAMMA07-459 [hydrothermal vent metagenome]|uniref:Cobalt transporter subunit CbtB (Proposed) n=1 Tax=hydrothermal vent metagenome TaxID=652676 RepID=A0A3B0WFL1_9ZZZZ
MSTTTQTAQSTTLTLSSTMQIISASLVALVVLYGVGFNEMDVAHNAAHDARHATVFPCH